MIKRYHKNVSHVLYNCTLCTKLKDMREKENDKERKKEKKTRKMKGKNQIITRNKEKAK